MIDPFSKNKRNLITKITIEIQYLKDLMNAENMIIKNRNLDKLRHCYQ